MAEAPDFQQPFHSDGDRALTLSDLLQLGTTIEQCFILAGDPERLGPVEAGALDVALVAGDTPKLELRRWRSLFNDELRAVMDARNRAVHGIRLEDAEMRGAVWLARQLLSLVDPVPGDTMSRANN